MTLLSYRKFSQENRALRIQNIFTLLASLTISFVTGVEFVHAKLTPQQCKAIRDYEKSMQNRWFGISKSGNIIPLENNLRYSESDVYKVAYLHFRDDNYSSATFVNFGFKYITLNNKRDSANVRVRGASKKGFNVTIDEFQNFHENKSDSIFIKNNFHFRKSFRRGNPFTTFKPINRRKQPTFSSIKPDDSSEYDLSYRSELIRLEGINPAGSCVDVGTFPPTGTVSVKIDFVDLKRDENSILFPRVSIEFKLGNTE